MQRTTPIQSATPTLASLNVVEAPRCRLAPLRKGDAALVQALTDDPEVIASVSFLRAPFTLADAEALIEKRDGGSETFFGLWNRSDGALAGVIGAHADGSGAIEIGYWVGAGFRGRGYAAEAARALTAALQERFPGAEIYAECKPDNRASWKSLENCGFVATGQPGARPERRRLRYVAVGRNHAGAG